MTTELDRLIDSAKAAQRLAEEMLATKTDPGGGMETVARGLANASRAAELTAEQQKGRDLVNRVLALPKDAFGEPIRPSDDPARGLFDEQAKAGIVHAIKTRTPYRVETKATLTVGSLLPSSGSYVVGGLHPIGMFPLATLFRAEPALGPVQRYYRMGAGTAAIVAEGALKPDAGISITGVDLAISKIAATTQFTDEMTDDAPYLVQWLGQELTAAVIDAENTAILDTFAATSGVLTGTGAAATVVDLVADAIAGQEAVSGLTPSAVVAHPNVIADIRQAKASTSGDYVIDPTAPGPSSLHGVRLISSPATAADKVWVIEPSGVLIYRRNVLTVEVGTNADDWVHNTRTARAEERMGTAVVRPSALTVLTLT